VRQGRQVDWRDRPGESKLYPPVLPALELNRFPALADFLALCCGPSARKLYPGGALVLRVVPSAGALYPCELYLQARGADCLPDGIYHVEPLRGRLRRLHSLAPDEGLEGYWPGPGRVHGLVLLVTAMYGRSSWKYGSRGLRYCLLDSGHLLGAMEAAASVTGRPLFVRCRFDRQRLARDFGFSSQELPMAMAISGREEAVRVRPPRLDPVPETGQPVGQADPVIEESFRAMTWPSGKSETAGLYRYGCESGRLRAAIMARRSVRRFTGAAVEARLYAEVRRCLEFPVAMDCGKSPTAFAVVNRVRGMEPGLYHGQRLVRRGDLSRLAGYLCLEQRLASDSGLTLFLASAADAYPAVMLRAGWLGQRIYLAATLAGAGCSGIGALYDWECMDFLAIEEMVLYALVVGR